MSFAFRSLRIRWYLFLAIATAAADLIKLIDPHFSNSNPPNAESCPRIILSFDESHVLAEKKYSEQPLFFYLRRTLRALQGYPIFSLFLSMMSKISNFAPAVINDPSNRIVDGTLDIIPPFTELGFDQLANRLVENKYSIEDVSTLEFMARFGRPLYVPIFSARHLDW